MNKDSYPDIFFGLKGGFNNFGIVTNFNMRAVPQTLVYGGALVYIPLQFDAAIQAIVNFQTNNNDTKAQIGFSFVIVPGQFILLLVISYDAPTPPSGLFDEFLAIGPVSGTLQTLTYSALIQAAPASTAGNLLVSIFSFQLYNSNFVYYRGRYTTISVTNITTQLLSGFLNQIILYNSTLGTHAGAFFVINSEPVQPSAYKNSQGGAYPHGSSATPPIPIFVQFSWVLPSDDEVFIDAVETVHDTLSQMVMDQGQNVSGTNGILYPNYALASTSLSEMYGDNVARLRSIRQAWDPENIMYLTGGFKF